MELAILIIGAIENLTAAWPQVRKDLEQSGEYTPDQLKQLDDRMDTAMQQRRWKPDDQL